MLKYNSLVQPGSGFSFERKLLVFSFLIVAMIVTMIVIYMRLSEKSRTAREWVNRAETIIQKTEDIRLDLKDIVISTRGYIITGQKEFTHLHKQRSESISRRVDSLQLLVKLPVQQRRLDSIGGRVAAYNAVRERSITLARSNGGEIAGLMNQSQAILQELDDLFFRFDAEEKSLLQERRNDYRKNMQRSVLGIRVLLWVFILSLVSAFILIYRNSIRRKKAVLALRENQKLIRNIIDHSPILINVKDVSGHYLLVNNQFAALMGTTPENIVGKKAEELIKSETTDFIRTDISEDEILVNTKQPSEFQSTIRSPEGLNSFITAKFPLVDDKGKLYGIGATSTDITPVKQAHDALLDSYKQQQRIVNGLQQAVSSSTDLLCMINAAGEFVMISDTVKDLLGFSSKELMSKRYIDYVSEEDREATEAVAGSVMQGLPLTSFINHYRKKDGTTIPIEWSAKWVEEDQMMYCLARNATAKVMTERQLAQSQARLAHAQKIAGLGYWDWNLHTNERTYSEEIYEILGKKKDDNPGFQEFLIEAIHPDDRAMMNRLRDEALRNGTKIDMEHRIIRADNKVRYVHTIGEIMVDTENKPYFFSGTMQDITERKKAELHLKKLNETLEKRAAELKDSNTELERFAYVASHDLQEPLRMVTSFMALLQKRIEDKLDETSAKYFHFAIDGANRMKNLIQDLLQFSRLGTTTGEITVVDCNEILKNTLAVFETLIIETNATITSTNLPVIKGNKTELGQLFQNLLGNALKYRGEQKPHIEIGATEKENEYSFFVKDNGIGIDAKFYDKIFVIFQRLHNKNEYSGTGIGLAICKKIVERHGGKIWLESEAGKGSTFYFTLKKSI